MDLHSSVYVDTVGVLRLSAGMDFRCMCRFLLRLLMYEDVFCECVFRGRLWYSRYAAEIYMEYFIMILM